mmetsp:Transcript_29567/g.62803  ORF Transcript_29567/g.62803 Transcript_29567/m.62803 type:complete len:330 (+) Transcript_29567:60-1049(+)
MYSRRGFGQGYGGGGYGGARRRRGQEDRSTYMMLMLAGQIAQKLNQLEKKPPVTVFLLALNCAAYYVPDVRAFFPSVQEACLRPEFLRRGESLLNIFSPTRLGFSAFLHGSEYHLYHNMLSLLSKGIQLELKHKSARFALMTLFLLGSSNALYVVISHLRSVAGWSPSCAIGFSGVLFGYKVISQMEASGSGKENSFFGLVNIPKGLYLSWLELLSIQFAYPNASFLGHLCGIISGYLYYLIFLKPQRAGPGGRSGGRGGGGSRASGTTWFRDALASIFGSGNVGASGGRFHGHGTTGAAKSAQDPKPKPSSSSTSYQYVRDQRTKKFT